MWTSKVGILKHTKRLQIVFVEDYNIDIPEENAVLFQRELARWLQDATGSLRSCSNRLLSRFLH